MEIILDNRIRLQNAHTATDNRREELKARNFKELISLYKTLPAADIQKLQGEVAGTILATPNIISDIISWISTNSIFPGRWVGKGFKANTSNSSDGGKGYNRFRILGRENRSMRFITRMDVSAVDGKPVMMMDYKPCSNPLGWIGALDEIRQIDTNNYLLCGYWFWPLLGRSQFFMYHIYGPAGEFKDSK